MRSRLPERLAPTLPPLLLEAAIGIVLPLFFSLLRLALVPLAGDRAPYALTFVAVAAATVVAGWRSGLVAIIVGQALAWYLIVSPAYSFAGKGQALAGGLAIATVAELIMLAIIAAYQREMRKALAERENADRARDLLVQELDHRVKNTLAVVQSIAHQTIKPRDGDALDAFDARLTALGGAYADLTRTDWTGASVRAVLDNSLRPFAESGRRIRLDGPDVEVSPKAAIYLALAMHELATNASKYGALTSPDGSVEVTWVNSADGFQLSWTENGGPAVRKPSKRGFGTRLIERGLAAELGGQVELDFDPAGVRCRILAPALAG